MKFIYHSISLKGLRETNEDEHIIFKNLNNKKRSRYDKVDYISIFDGHGGKDVSQFLKPYLYKKLITGINYSKTKPVNFKKKNR